MELVERVAICEIEIENVKEKVDKQDKLIDSIYELASGQKELNAKMDIIPQISKFKPGVLCGLTKKDYRRGCQNMIDAMKKYWRS